MDQLEVQYQLKFDVPIRYQDKIFNQPIVESIFGLLT